MTAPVTNPNNLVSPDGSQDRSVGNPAGVNQRGEPGCPVQETGYDRNRVGAGAERRCSADDNATNVPDVQTEDTVSRVAEVTSSLVWRRLAAQDVPERFFIDSVERSSTSSCIGFVNQGNITLLECRAEAIQLLSLSEYAIDVIYNNSVTGWDSEEVMPRDVRVRLLHQSWDSFFDDPENPRQLRMQTCAGDATYIVRTALESYDPNRRRRILVVAIAPSCTIPERLCCSVIYYRAQGDVSSSRLNQDVFVLPRSPDCRGALGLLFHSSTFQNFIALEMVCFSLRRRLVAVEMLPGNFDRLVANLRTDCLRQAQRMAGRHSLPEIQAEIQGVLLRFTAALEVRGLIGPLDNVYERAEAELIRTGSDGWCWRLNLSRDLISIISTTVAVFNSSARLSWWMCTVPLLEFAGVIRRNGAYIVPMNATPHFLRRASLRASWFDGVIFATEAGIWCYISAGSNQTSLTVFGLYSHLIFSNIVMFSENVLRLFSPLRGRIQERLTQNPNELVGTVQHRNEDAYRCGWVRRIGRSLSQAVYSLGAMTVAGVCIYSMMTDRRDDSETGETNQAGLIMMGVTGVVSATSLVLNIRQALRIVQRLHNRGAFVRPLPHGGGNLGALDGDSDSDSDHDE